jgi:hypothetical protein
MGSTQGWVLHHKQIVGLDLLLERSRCTITIALHIAKMSSCSF